MDLDPSKLRHRVNRPGDHRKILKVIPRNHETDGYGDLGTITEFVYNSLMAVGTSMATVDHIMEYQPLEQRQPGKSAKTACLFE